MDWQLAIVVAALALSLTYLVRVGVRSWKRSQAGCAGGCGCSGKANAVKTEQLTDLIPSDDIRLRRRI